MSEIDIPQWAKNKLDTNSAAIRALELQCVELQANAKTTDKTIKEVKAALDKMEADHKISNALMLEKMGEIKEAINKAQGAMKLIEWLKAGGIAFIAWLAGNSGIGGGPSV